MDEIGDEFDDKSENDKPLEELIAKKRAETQYMLKKTQKAIANG